MAKFLESNNTVPNINYLLDKVEDISKRHSLDMYLKILSEYEDKICFYCKKNIQKTTRNMHVDHFIPWSFIQNDNLWNLVIACQKCNTKKSDKLAEETFLHSLVERNEILSKEIRKEQFQLFSNYREEKLIQLYKYSIYNGLTETWSPNLNS